MNLSIQKQYSRKSNIVYENTTPIIRLKQKFIDIEILSETAINYMNRYIEAFPDLIEIIVDKSEKKNEQFSLF